MFLLIYVDDIILTSTPNAHFSELLDSLHKGSPVKDLGLLIIFLVLRFTILVQVSFLRSPSTSSLLDQVAMLDCKSSLSLVSSGSQLFVHDGQPLSELTTY